MELKMQTHRWLPKSPHWPSAVASGFCAGAILMVLELLWAVAWGNNPWAASHNIAALAMGPTALTSTSFDITTVLVALFVHYAIGIAFGVGLSILVASFNFDSSAGMVLLSGAAFGLAMYLFNFYIAIGAFSWFESMRGWPTVAGHLVFGASSALIYWKLEPRT